MRYFTKYLLFFCFLFVMAGISKAQGTACLRYRQYPLPGHPVDIIDLNPSDKYYPFLDELRGLKLILLEPGICEVKASEKGWFKGRVFVFKSRSANFSHGNIISIELGRFR